MERIKQFIKTYSMYIIVVLFALLLLKNCQSCSKSNAVDHLNKQVELRCDTIRSLNDSLTICHQTIERLNHDIALRDSMSKAMTTDMKATINDLRKSNSSYRNANSTLTKSNRDLIIKTNKPEIEE